MTNQNGAALSFKGFGKYTLQGSSDFQTWTNLLTTFLPEGASTFVDTHAADFSQRFYRLNEAIEFWP